MGRPFSIDITRFDPDDAAGERVVYCFRREHMEHPLETIRLLAANPSAFHEGKYEAVLTDRQNARFLRYLKKGDYYREDFVENGAPDYLLALAYGQAPDVNSQLATIVQESLAGEPSIETFAQREIADNLFERDERLEDVVKRIPVETGKSYTTTIDVVQAFKRRAGAGKSTMIFLVCQAWHAPRAIRICENEGLTVVRGEFVDEFSPNDPQTWVRSWLAWVLKEGTRE